MTAVGTCWGMTVAGVGVSWVQQVIGSKREIRRRGVSDGTRGCHM